MKYKHIIFDIDGTMIDTESAVLSSLQITIQKLQYRKIELAELSFALGIPGQVTLKKLGVEDVKSANELWNLNFKECFSSVHSFQGIHSLLSELNNAGVQLGIITSKNRTEYQNDFLPFCLDQYFETVICVEDSSRPKPYPEPMLKYLEITGAKKEDVLYIGDTIYDMQCALNAGVDFGLARWGCRSVKHIYATYYFETPQDVIYTLNKNTDAFEQLPWLKWAMELQFISQAGITYSKDKFDIERFERLREISAEIMSAKTEYSKDTVRSVFCNETGFQTPKLDTRAAIFQNGKILLVKENDGRWALPGGWVDVNQSIKSNTIKEVKEEAGLDVLPTKIIALQDRNMHNLPLYAYGVCKVFVLCEIIGGNFVSNIETIGSSYFELNELPSLAEEKNTMEEIKLCFEAYMSANWNPVFD